MDKKICFKCKGKNLELLSREKEYNVKGNTKIKIEEKFLKCEDCGEILFDEEIEKENLKILYDKYRIEKNLLFPEEIKAIREKYDLGQRTFSKILGWGEITIHRYENNNIIDEAHSNMLSLIKNPLDMEILLEKNKEKISSQLYNKIKSRILEIEKENNEKGKELSEILGNKINEFSGYIKFNFDKLKNMILFMIENGEGNYKTKLWKLLFYSDILYFKENLVSITGTTYIKNHYGPTPEKHSSILAYLIDKLEIIDIEYDSYGNEILVNKGLFDESKFEEDELEVMKKVAVKFKKYSAKEIAEYSHKEKAWLEPSIKDLISFDKYSEEIEL